MSNPGVIILDTKKKNIIQRIFNRNSFRYFQIEDNIGEAIHIHFDDFRIELSINEFFEISDCFKEALNQLVGIKNFDINQIDPLFFKYASNNLEDLESIEDSNEYFTDSSNTHSFSDPIPIPSEPSSINDIRNQEQQIYNIAKDALNNKWSNNNRVGAPSASSQAAIHHPSPEFFMISSDLIGVSNCLSFSDCNSYFPREERTPQVWVSRSF